MGGKTSHSMIHVFFSSEYINNACQIIINYVVNESHMCAYTNTTQALHTITVLLSPRS